jgi:hypothetical protein
MPQNRATDRTQFRKKKTERNLQLLSYHFVSVMRLAVTIFVEASIYGIATGLV